MVLYNSTLTATIECDVSLLAKRTAILQENTNSKFNASYDWMAFLDVRICRALNLILHSRQWHVLEKPVILYVHGTENS